MLQKTSPEGIEIANTYLATGSIARTAELCYITEDKVTEYLDKAEVRRYIDTVYLDTGYRNKFKLGSLLDKIIESKLEEAEESEIYTNKDLLDVMLLAHKMRMDELAAMAKATTVQNQTNVQINAEGSVFGAGNYGKLMEKLLGGPDGAVN